MRMAEGELRQAGYRTVGQATRTMLQEFGFKPRRGPPYSKYTYTNYWFPIAVINLAAESHLPWFGPEADRTTIDRRDAVLCAIAADPVLEAALHAVWTYHYRRRASASGSVQRAVFMYVMEALPELFGGCLLPPGSRS